MRKVGKDISSVVCGSVSSIRSLLQKCVLVGFITKTQNITRHSLCDHVIPASVKEITAFKKPYGLHDWRIILGVIREKGV